MADWTAAIGSGTIMIRDTGGNVEFWITAGNNTAWDYDLKWSGWINGRGVGGTFRYESGMGWQRVFVEYVGSNQGVSFTKTENSGSTGLGGPATVNATINRATVPAAPTPIGLDQIEQTSMRYRFSGNSNGGAAILEWQIGYGTDPNNVQFTTGSGGTTVVGGLSPAKVWYFWARGRNSVGWGPWSARSSAETLAGARVKVGGVWKKAIPYVKVANVWKLAQPFVKVAGAWKKTL